MTAASNNSMQLEGKTILLGITGGIAAYKSCNIVRLLQKRGARVTVVMSEHAPEFVGPLTFRALTNEPVAVGLSLIHISFDSSLERRSKRMHNPILLTAICAVVSFFIGAIPFGLILGLSLIHISKAVLVLGKTERHNAQACDLLVLLAKAQGLFQLLAVAHAGAQHNLRVNLDADRKSVV